ncbi:hypothetical protein LQ564_17905 [Massilia sp. G4R7]|uniref:KfrA N-terminal DNA-binding domain-containing protein n=1 Tax=Massilia phyllostachyos TaxID=2898585 RepID=A0ABS8Q8V2_9BURK|nr:hypothetical protein [Massilia phyllostachyos]MCD2518187.1 hypothetical protein [Massilia phyllostachyos]
MKDDDVKTVAAMPAMPDAVASALGNWVQQVAEQTAAPAREALARVESEVGELQAEIDRLNTELRDARKVAADALVSKAKDQLAIDGKDRQLADLRGQLERNVAAQAVESDARLAAEMELVGAATARDNFEAELKTLRGQLDKSYAERSTLRAELEALRAKK